MGASAPLNIGFAGLGAMGFGMASHLLSKGHNITGFDVYEPSLAKFRALGGQVSSSPKDAARGKDYFIVMVANSTQADSVLFNPENGAVQGKRAPDLPASRFLTGSSSSGKRDFTHLLHRSRCISR